jgi:Fic family protein
MAYDPDVPYNELPLLPPATDLDDIQILKKVNTANIALARLNGVSLAVPNRELLLEPLTVREAVASSGIENINTTVSEVFQAELFPLIEAPKPQKETLHYKQALLFGHRFIKEKGYFATNAISEIQAMLEPEKKRHSTSARHKNCRSNQRHDVLYPTGRRRAASGPFTELRRLLQSNRNRNRSSRAKCYPSLPI